MHFNRGFFFFLFLFFFFVVVVLLFFFFKYIFSLVNISSIFKPVASIMDTHFSEKKKKSFVLLVRIL